MNGYKSKNKIDTSWWMTQITSGVAFRKKYAKEAKWNDWRDYYRGDWKAGVLPSNVFFKMIRTVVPRIYFRNPSISITSRRMGPEGMAFAKVLERVDNKLIRKMKVKEQTKRIVQNAWMFGTGWGKLGYGAEYTPTPDDIDTASPETKIGKVEYNSLVQTNMPWFMSAHTGSIIVPDGSTCMDEIPWIAQWIRRPIDAIREDTRLKNVKDLSASAVVKSADHKTRTTVRPMEMGDLIEIRDKRTGQVFVIAPYGNTGKVALQEEDALQVNGRLPYYPVVFNDDDEVLWGVPDSAILEPQQLELNEIRTLEMQHRRLGLLKILAKKNSIDVEEIEKILNGEATGVAWVTGELRSSVMPFPASGVPNELYKLEELLHRDIRESMGFSRNEFGEYKGGSGDTTATEAQIVKMASEIRIDERRDMLADMLVDMVTDMHTVIFERWDDEQVIDVAGPFGIPLWVSFKGTMLKGGQYDINIDPDTSIPQTKQLRESKAVQVYGLLKENPLIDPIGLTKMLLSEMYGVSYDYLLQGMTPGLGAQNNPMNMDQFQQFIGKASQIPGAQGAANASA